MDGTHRKDSGQGYQELKMDTKRKYLFNWYLQSPCSFTNTSQIFLWPSMTYCVYQVVSLSRGCLWHSFTSVQQHHSAVTVPRLQAKTLPHLTAEPPNMYFGCISPELLSQTTWGHTDIKHVCQIRHIIVMSLKLPQQTPAKFSALNLCFFPLFEHIKHKKCCIHL